MDDGDKILGFIDKLGCIFYRIRRPIGFIFLFGGSIFLIITVYEIKDFAYQYLAGWPFLGTYIFAFTVGIYALGTEVCHMVFGTRSSGIRHWTVAFLYFALNTIAWLLVHWL